MPGLEIPQIGIYNGQQKLAAKLKCGRSCPHEEDEMMQRVGDERSWNYEEKRTGQKQKDKMFFLNEAGMLLEHQDSRQIREKFRKYVADANSNNDMTKKAAQEGACRDLEFFVINMINRKFGTYTAKDQIFFEDLMQAGRLGIIQSLPKYDPEKSMPTTYFFTAILHEMTAVVNSMKHDTKSYIAALKRKIREVDREFAKYDRTPSLHDYVYSIGDPFNRVMNVLAQVKAGNIMTSIDDPDNAWLWDKLASTCRPEEIAASEICFNQILQLAREIEPDEDIVQCFVETSMGMANTAQLAEKYHRSPAEITEKILNLKNLLKNHEDIRELYPERFRTKENSRSGRLCV